MQFYYSIHIFKILLVCGTVFINVTGSGEILRYSLLRNGTTFTSSKAKKLQSIQPYIIANIRFSHTVSPKRRLVKKNK
jgi:hypothetical protein